MTNEVKNVPELRFSDFSDEWEEKKLEDLLKFNNGINASKEQYGTGMKFINVLDILNTNFITYDKIIGRVNVSKAIENRNKVEYGDILFLRSSETREDVGMCNVYLDKEKHSLYGGFIIRGKKIGEYSPFFLKILLNNSKARKSISSLAGGSTRFNVSQDILKVVGILVPKMNEQIKIGDFFNKLDQQIELEEQKLSLLEEQKKGYMQDFFSKSILFKDEKGNINYNWSKFQVKDIFPKIESGNRLPKNNLVEGNVPYVIAQTTNNGVFMYISENTLDYHKNKLKLFKKGSITISIDNPEAMFIQKENFFTSNVMRVLYNEHLKKESHIYIMEILRKLTRTYNWSVKFSGPIIMNSIIELPIHSNNGKINWNIVNQIGDFFNTFEKRINKQLDKIELLKERKKGFLQKMFV